MSARLASATFGALGTSATVVVDDARALPEARRLLAAELDAIDRACSRFRPDAELVALNGQAGRTTPVGRLLADAVEVALRAAEQTAGLVDPTVGPALAALGYDRDFDAMALTGRDEVSGIVASGWRTVAYDARRRTVRLAPGTQLDLGATAKALAADRAAATVAERTGASVLVSLGGDIATAGPPPGGGWAVRIADDHRADDGTTVTIHGGGLATSSTTVRRWRRGGRAVHHIVDPATGEPAVPVWRTVTVAAASCVDSNTASTAAVVMGERASEWLAGLRLPSRLVAEDGRVVTVAEWPAE